jgi:DNA-binding CsgD family transcriptional regulator
MAKSNKYDMIQREKIILDRLGKGDGVSDICRDLSAAYNCSESAIRKQYENIMKAMAEKQAEAMESTRQMIDIRLDFAYRKAVETENIKNMIDAAKEKARLHGLYEKKEVESKLPNLIEFEEKDFSGIKIVGDNVDEKK